MVMDDFLDISSDISLAAFYYRRNNDDKFAKYVASAKAKIISSRGKPLFLNEIRDKLTVVVRTIGERTTGACVASLNAIVPSENIILISEKPFSKAVRKGFAEALNADRKWTLIIDADVLVRANFACEILGYAELLGDDVFLVQGLVHDKLLGTLRAAGNHLYRTVHLEQALGLIPKEGSTLRPENTTTRNMISRNKMFVQTPYLAGLHDYEQDYFDIAKKCFLHTHKHTHFLPILCPKWEELAQIDADFQAALIGASCGASYDGTVLVDSDFFAEQLMVFLEGNEVPAKPAFDSKSYSDEKICSVLCECFDETCNPVMQYEHFIPKNWWWFWSGDSSMKGEQYKYKFLKAKG